MQLLNFPDNLFSFKKYFIKIAKLYICIVSNIHIKYSHYEPFHFKLNWTKKNEDKKYIKIPQKIDYIFRFY